MTKTDISDSVIGGTDEWRDSTVLEFADDGMSRLELAEYSLTELGQTLVEPLRGLIEWANEHAVEAGFVETENLVAVPAGTPN